MLRPTSAQLEPPFTADLNVAVVRPHPQQPRHQRRLRHRHDRAVAAHPVVARQDALLAAVDAVAARQGIGQAHQLDLVAVGVLRQVGAHGPGVAPVQRAEETVAARVHHVRVVGRQDERRVPVPADLGARVRRGHDVRVGVVARRRARADAPALAGGQAGAPDVAVLRLEVDDGVVGRVHGRVEAVAAAHAVPVLAQDVAVAHPAGPAPGAVVLQSGADVVGPPHVHRRVVGLSDRPAPERLPGLAPVVAHVDRAVVADDQVIAVVGVDPEGVLVDVPVAVHHLEVLAAVGRHVHALVDHVHHVRVVRIDADLAEVHGAPVLVAAELPARALVAGAPDAVVLGIGGKGLASARQTLQLLAFLVRQRLLAVGRDLDLRVHHVRVGRGHGQRDPAHGPPRQPAPAQPGPGLAAVVGAPDAAAGPSAHEAAGRAAALVGGREERVGVGGIDDEVGRAGVLVHDEHVVPGAAAVAVL